MNHKKFYSGLFLIVVLIILSTGVIISAEEDLNVKSYYDIINDSEQINTSIGTVYLQIPKKTYFGEPIKIIFALDKKAESNNKEERNIILENKPFNTKRKMWVEDTPKGNLFLITRWDLILWQNKTLKIKMSTKEEILLNHTLDLHLQEMPLKETKVVKEEEINTTPSQETKELLRTEFSKNKNKFITRKQFQEMIDEAEKNFKITQTIKQKKKITKTNKTLFSTEVTIHIKPLSDKYSEVILLTKIPKEIIENAEMIKSRPEAEVLKEDPVIMWHVKSNETINYELPKQANITGNTVAVVSEVINEQEKTKFSWKIILPILIIPIIAGIMIFFAKYEPES